MLFKNITIIDDNFDVKENMYVGIKDDRFTYIGEKIPEEDFGEIYDGKYRLMMPAFYNAHAHSPMALMRGYGENLVLQDWLNTKIFPFEDRLDSNAVYWGTMLCMAESIRYGIVSSQDMYYFVPDMVKAVLDSGAKNNISRAIANPMGVPCNKLESIKELKYALANFHNAGNGRVKMDASIHAEYTSNEETVDCVVDIANSANAIMHVHISETKLEHEECKIRRNGLTPTAYFAKHGAFDMPALAAHCVWCTDEDLEILAEKGVYAATNPVSNLKLASGIAPVVKMQEKGVKIAIGTDSVASNNNLNFMEEIKTMAILAKTNTMNPTVITPKEAIMFATRNGALAQGRTDCGSVAVGNKADFILLNTLVPNMHPVHNMLNNVVYSATPDNIVMTVSDGKILYKDGEYLTIDIEKTIAEAGRATEKILIQL